MFSKISTVLGIAVLPIVFLTSCATDTSTSVAKAKPGNVPPALKREFRAAWVATVANIDWPSRSGLPVEQQKSELIEILERAAALKLNAIILQVRPACDAYYPSKIEPWSQFLTGEMGKAPEPFYDPLEFAVAESHKRGLELHAWFNPYRAMLKGKSEKPVATNHISKLHPEYVREYGSFLWLDPTEEASRQYSLSVIRDVVKRYDVDGVQFDDYFYPYAEIDKATKKAIPFPDDANWAKYQASGGKLKRADWRRENVDKFIQAVGQVVKEEKPWVKYGISPFGVWKDGEPCKALCDSYNDLFGDARKWMQEGWVDYIAPQLYWRSDYPGRSYSSLLKWWGDNNTKGRHLWPGLFDSNIGNNEQDGTPKMTAQDIKAQALAARSQFGASGVIHYSMKALMKNQGGVSDAISEIYTEPAVIPASPWLSKAQPAAPQFKVKKTKDSYQFSWKPANEPTRFWVLQTKTASGWQTRVLSGDQTSCNFPLDLPEVVALRAIDRFGNESEPSIYQK